MRRLAEWLFRDRRNGEIVVGQWPNWPLALFIVAASAQWALQGLHDDSWAAISRAASVAATLFLLWWSVDELTRGVNPWRRCLGASGLLYAIWRAAQSW